MFRYSAYGLELVSDMPLPELDRIVALREEAAASVSVQLQPTDHHDLAPRLTLRSMLPDGDELALFGKVEDGFLLRYRGFADFIVDPSARKLRCVRVESGTAVQTLRHLLLDQVLPMVLNLLGRDVLHATAVDTPGGVCAFIGPAGAGKSTLAASFAAMGYPIFCDDCLVVGCKPEILCTPGYPGVRLWSDSASALGKHLSKQGEVAGYTSKFRLTSPNGQFPKNPRPLAAIYRISRAADAELTDPCIEPLTGRAAFVELVYSSYVLDVTEPATLRRHFRGIEQLVAQVPIARVLLPNHFDLLPAARTAILNDLTQN